MDIIKCKCGYYKMLDDELCPVCRADYSTGAEYELLDDQELQHERWKKLGGEKGFNDYMKSINAPSYMICPNCRFRMLTSERNCPKCGIAVKPPKKNSLSSINDKVQRKTITFAANILFWFTVVPALVAFAIYAIGGLLFSFF